MLYWGRTPRAFFGFLWMLAAFKRKRSPIGKTDQALVRLRISQILHCPFCIDMNASEAYQLGLSRDKLSNLARYNESPHYNEDERMILAYAEAVVRAEPQRNSELQRRLQTKFSDDAIIELTALIAHQAMSALFNAALEIPPHGFCGVPKKTD